MKNKGVLRQGKELIYFYYIYKQKKPKPEHTHLKIKNAAFLNKAIRKLHSKRNQTIEFTDVVNGNIEDIRVNIHCDASLTNVIGKKAKSECAR